MVRVKWCRSEMDGMVKRSTTSLLLPHILGYPEIIHHDRVKEEQVCTRLLAQWRAVLMVSSK